MKKIISILFCCAGLMACQQKPEGYVINGDIAGNSDGMKVQLVYDREYPPIILDSAIIENKKFQFKGKLEQPGEYQIIIDKSGKGDEAEMLASKFYLENSVITYSGHIDSLPAYFWTDETFRREPIIQGSAAQDLYNQYQKEMAEVNKRARELDDQYMEIYHLPSIEGIFNTEEGVRISRQIEKVNQERSIVQWNFIEKHPGSIIGYDLAYNFLSGYFTCPTVAQINQLTDIITKAWANNPKMVEDFKTAAEKAKTTALGVKYQDVELMNPEGKMVKLSEYIPEGKYVMLEFWASWCGPCRGEIPHLRRVYQEYKDKGFEIISISLDEKKESWKKAMEEESMVWKQLCDPEEFDGPVAEKYNLTGVPTCILLDKEGRIFKTEMRGAALDAVLQELY